MIDTFHPAAEAEFLESVGYYESEVPGLGGAFEEEFEALAELIGDSPKGWQVARYSQSSPSPISAIHNVSRTARRFPGSGCCT